MAVEQPRSGGAPEAGLRIDRGEREGWTVLAFEGELDLAESPDAIRAFATAAESATRGIEADLTELAFLGSTGIRVIIDASTDALGRGLGFRVVPGDGPARRIIDLLGLAERLGVDETPG